MSIKERLNQIGIEKIDIGVILGSGLGDTIEGAINIKAKLPYSDIPGFPISTVVGHIGRFLFSEINGYTVSFMQGRFHPYEGYSIDQVVKPIELFSEMGAKLLIVTNAAGGANPHFQVGDLMIIKDYINFFFMDIKTKPYLNTNIPFDKELSNILKKVALENKIDIKEGTLFSSTGPTYETPAEVRMAKFLGGDALSMSTIPEVIIARDKNIKVVGISSITNIATGLYGFTVSHQEVIDVAKTISAKFRTLIINYLQYITKNNNF